MCEIHPIAFESQKKESIWQHAFKGLSRSGFPPRFAQTIVDCTEQRYRGHHRDTIEILKCAVGAANEDADMASCSLVCDDSPIVIP